MEEKTENLWHNSWPGFSAPQIYLEDMESTSYETLLESDSEEEYFSCLEDIDMEEDSREAEVQEKGSITIQSGHNLLCALSQRKDHEENMGPCPSQGVELDVTSDGALSHIPVPEVNEGTGPTRDTEDNIGHGPNQDIELDVTSDGALSHIPVPEVNEDTGPTRDTEDNIGHGPSQSTNVNVTDGASMSQSAVPEVNGGTGPTREREGTIGDGPSQDTEFDISFGGPVPPCLYPEVIIIPGPRWESEESLNVLPSWREEYEDAECVLPSPNEDNLHGEKNQNPDRKKKRWRLKGLRKQIHRLCCCFFCCILTPTEEAPTPRSEEQAWGHGS